MPTLVNNLRAIRGPVTAVPVTPGSGIEIAADTENNQIVISTNLEAGSGIDLQESNGKVIVSADETVLWSGEKMWWLSTGALALSESVNNFEIIRILARDDWEIRDKYFYVPSNPTNNAFDITLSGIEGSKLVTKTSKYVFAGASITLDSYFACELNASKAINVYIDRSYIQFKEVVGINRIANN